MPVTIVSISMNLCEGMDIVKRDEADWRNNGSFEKNIMSVRKHWQSEPKLVAGLLG